VFDDGIKRGVVCWRAASLFPSELRHAGNQ
jgi:hypothetical protein